MATKLPSLTLLASKLPGRTQFFPNVEMALMPTRGRSIQKNVIRVRVPPRMGKTEIKQMLTRAYGLNVIKVNTLNVDGQKKRTAIRTVRKEPDYKAVYVMLDSAVDLFEEK